MRQMNTLRQVLLVSALCAIGWSSRSAQAAPIEISTVAQLQLIGSGGGYPLDGDYVLVQDIDSSPTAAWNSGQGFAPIGSYAQPFTGTLDGGGHVVSELVINRPGAQFAGLFGAIGPAGSVSNLTLTSASLTAKPPCGILGGYVEGTLSRCFVSSSVVAGTDNNQNLEGWDSVGGLAGWLEGGAVDHCVFDGTVAGTFTNTTYNSGPWAGGLIGRNVGGVVQRCASHGTVTADGSSCQAGGLIGHYGWRNGTTEYGKVENSFTTANVEAKRAGTAGGLIAAAERFSVVRRCSASGNVKATMTCGGLFATSQGTVTDCYARGSVRSVYQAQVGGLAGTYENGAIANTYATGALTSDVPNAIFGGLIAYAPAWMTANGSFWDTTSSGISKSAGGTGKTTAEMQMSSTFGSAGWDMSGMDGDPAVWTIVNENASYPILVDAQSVGLTTRTVGAAAGPNAVVGVLAALLPGSGIEYSLVAGEGADHNNLFNIDGADLRVNDPSKMTPGDYSVRVQAAPVSPGGKGALKEVRPLEAESAVSVLIITIAKSPGPAAVTHDAWVVYH